ncbi:ribosomal RNA processing protein 1 homolog [Plakobranchus ocellatus]|uniref:Ribosomal RNA processing protein 1 homolog n=1 Tax=Plakobranchus ocellatus TaxID=259542 RepID=A0AAV4C5N3_9GAST|nr:ribosomal RNA processing protein 1 homolog [Plakobranchus ocellatus]
MEGSEMSAEVHFAQKLASNEKKIRDRAIKRLRKYLFARANHGGLSENDMIKIWKGLHYCMWMQDKPLLQEELSGKIASLLHSFPSPEGALLFMQVFLETEAREWNGIDKLRLDKFMMMIREMFHQVFSLLSESEWQVSECKLLAQALALKVMSPWEARLPDGLKLHIADIYVDELSKVSLYKMSSRKMMLLLQPFISFIISSPKPELAKRVMSEVIVKMLNTVSTVKPQPAAKSKQASRGEDREDTADSETEQDIGSKEESMDIDGSSEESSENSHSFVVKLIFYF